MLSSLATPRPIPVRSIFPSTVASKKVSPYTASDPGVHGTKFKAAGFKNIALAVSCGAATPTPPIALDVGPMPITLRPFVQKAGAVSIQLITRIEIINITLCIYNHLLCLNKIRKTELIKYIYIGRTMGLL